jgi:addiction module HigA family antidote
MTAKKLPPIHPGEILKEEFLRPLKKTPYYLAKAIGVDPRRIHAIIHGERSITPDTALRLAAHFKMSPQFWMNLQSRYDLEMESDRIGERIAEQVEVLASS